MKNVSNRKFNTHWLALVGCALVISACSKSKTADISVTIPAKPANLGSPIFSSALLMGLPAAQAPMSLSEVNCLGINVIAKDIPPAPWDRGSQPPNGSDPKLKIERALAGEPCGYGGVTSKVVPYNASTGAIKLNLTVPAGGQRLFQLMGFKAPPGTCDAAMDAKDFFGQFQEGKVEPTELARTVADINGSTTINLNGKFDAARNFNHCSLNDGPFYYEMSFASVPSLAIGMKPQIVAKNGAVYTGYVDTTDSSLRIMRWDSSGVHPVGGAVYASGNLNSYGIDILNDGSPVVIYSQGASGGCGSASCAYVMKFNGSAWIQFDPSVSYTHASAGTISNCQIATTMSGIHDVVYATCKDSTVNIPITYHFADNDASPILVTGTAPSLSGVTNFQVKLIGGTIYLVYNQSTYTYLYNAPLDVWNGTAVAAIPQVGGTPSNAQLGMLKFSGVPQPVVSWSEGGSTTYMETFDGASWSTAIAVPSNGSATMFALNSDRLGNMIIAQYEAGAGTIVPKWSGTWTTIAPGFQYLGPNNYQPSTMITMAVGETNQRPYVYFINTNNNLVFAKP